MVRGRVRAPRRGPVPDRTRGVGNGMVGSGQLRSWPFAYGPQHGSSESAARRGPADRPAAQARERRPFARGCGGGAGPVRPVGHPGRRRGALARSGEAVFRLRLHGPGGTITPMALPTALVMGLFGASVVAAAGPSAWPTRAFVGPFVRARLLRTFILTIPAMFLVSTAGSRQPGISRPSIPLSITRC